MEPIKLDLSELQIEAPLLKGSVRYEEGPQAPSFTETLEKAMDSLKDTHQESAQLMKDYASGKDVDVTEVMLAMEKTSMTTELAMQVRNKLVEGYQEIIKMQL
tara:strand:- start:355 stop:663 length:309 start_codon:yes stop_codon:yes gene_type:complete